MRGPTAQVLMILAVVVSMAAGMKWHQGAVASVDQLDLGGVPSLLLVLRADDCPDRRGGMDRWLSSLGMASPQQPSGTSVDPFHPGGGEEGSVPGLDLLVVHLSPAGGPTSGELADGPLSRFRSVEADVAGPASRALRRAGVSGTPALLLLDGDGRVLLGEEVTEEGPGPRLALAGRIIQGLVAPPTPGSDAADRGDEGCLEGTGAGDGRCSEGDAWNS